MPNDERRVSNAIFLTIATMTEHWRRLTASRVDGPERAGSYYPHLGVMELTTRLRDASWAQVEHPAVLPPAVAFRAPLPGIQDVVALGDLPPEARIMVYPSKPLTLP